MSDNSQLTFPYPKIGTVVRPVGQGCIGCVAQLYCPAVYWYHRYTFKELTEAMGRACLSWTPNPADKLTFAHPTVDDYNEEDYMFLHGIGSEANRNGIAEGGGGSRQSEGI